MKPFLSLSVLGLSALLLTGCYTQLQYSRYAEEGSEQTETGTRAGDDVRKYNFYYKDYDAANWYARHGFGNYWGYPSYGMHPYGWWERPGIGFSLRHDWYRYRYFYTPLYAYWNDYIYHNGIVYRSYRFLDSTDNITIQRFAPRTIGTSRLGLTSDSRPLPVRAGTFGGSPSTNGGEQSGTTTTSSSGRESPSRVRSTGSESTIRNRTTGRSTVGTSSGNSGSSSSSGTTRSRDSDSSTTGSRSRPQ